MQPVELVHERLRRLAVEDPRQARKAFLALLGSLDYTPEKDKTGLYTLQVERQNHPGLVPVPFERERCPSGDQHGQLPRQPSMHLLEVG